MAVRAAYEKLASKLVQLNTLRSISGLLEWDQQVMMAPGGNCARGQQCAALVGVVHDIKTSPELGSLAEELFSSPEAQKELNAFEFANVKLARKEYLKTKKIPKELEEECARLSSEGYEVWVRARKESNWALFEPILDKWIGLKKQAASLIDSSADPYDVLLDEFERDMTSKRLDEVFTRVKERLIPLVDKVSKSSTKIDASVLNGKFDIKKQEELSRKVCTDMGFSWDHGRFDVSVHPFTSGIHPTDVRLTTRYQDDEFVQALSATVHETGHALYEQGRNKAYDNLPVNEALSMGMHESQSLLWERHISLSLPFWEKYWPLCQEIFADQLKGISAEAIYRAVNIVQPSFIRVEADECTYPLHVILRYEIERGLIHGTIPVKDVPTVWNQKMKEYLGIVPPNDTKGCLQDVHWSGGAIGYFPTYLLGAMFACQIFRTAERVIPDLTNKIRAGELLELKEWLNKNIHEKGSVMSSDELMKEVTGEPLNPDYFLDFLTTKYTALYNL